MASLSDLQLLLYRIKTHLVDHPVFVRGTGSPVDDPAHDRETKQLDVLSLQLSLIVRDLKSKANLLGLREQSLRVTNRGERYNEAASIRGQQADLNEVLKLAFEIQGLLEDLIRRNASLGEGELSQGLGEFIEKMYHLAHQHGETQQMPDGLSYLPAGRTQAGGSVESVTIF